MGIQAVIFDMDGLMFDTERVAGAGMIAALRAQGFEADEATLEKLLGIDYEGTKRALTECYGEGLDFGAAIAGMEKHIDDCIAHFGTPVKPGLFELLARLDEMGLPRAIASSSPRERILSNLKGAGLSGRFDAIVCGGDVAHGKPAPDIFLAAAKALGIAPESCMALEDSASGVEAAKRAGMKTVMVPDLHAPGDKDRAGLYALAHSLFDAIPLLGQES